MQVIFNNGQYRDNNPSAIALGTFDGIHLGHRKLISELGQQKKHNGYKTIIYTFQTHPMRILAPEKAPSQIMLLSEKIRGFSELDVDTLVINPFNHSFLHQTPQTFLNQLLDHFNVKVLIVGFNYRFGYKGMGDIEFLYKVAHIKGFELICVPPVKREGQVISSSLIRTLISNGNVEEAACLITKPYTIRGKIIHGFGRGRNMGFPTANIKVPAHKTIPKPGVYLTKCFLGNRIFWGVTSVGINPTFSQETLNIETYILDFREDIYDKILKVSFLEHLRDEIKFNSVEDLIVQMKLDVQNAKYLIYNFH